MLSNTTQPAERQISAEGWLFRHSRTVAIVCSSILHIALVSFVLGEWRYRTDPAVLIEERVRIQVHLAPPSAPPIPVAPIEAAYLTPDSSAGKDQPDQAPPTPVAVRQPDITLHVPAAEQIGQSTQPEDGQTQVASHVSVSSQAAAPPSPSLPPAPQLAGMSEPDWVGEVLARLEKFRRYPRSAQIQAQEGVVYVRARISRDGRVLAVQMRSSSGYPSLDQEALETFRRARSLPPPPKALPDPVVLDVPVEFFLR